MFTAPGGGVLRVGNFRKRVSDCATQGAGLEGLTPHELRHTAARLAVSAGANVKAVQRLLGRASSLTCLARVRLLPPPGVADQPAHPA
jgi:site-specific recombinase XerD